MPTDTELDRVAELREFRDYLHSIITDQIQAAHREFAAVTAGRVAGMTWQEIADAYSPSLHTRQAAKQRYARLRDRLDRAFGEE